jgi:hypothetical protein
MKWNSSREVILFFRRVKSKKERLVAAPTWREGHNHAFVPLAAVPPKESYAD